MKAIRERIIKLFSASLALAMRSCGYLYFSIFDRLVVLEGRYIHGPLLLTLYVAPYIVAAWVAEHPLLYPPLTIAVSAWIFIASGHNMLIFFYVPLAAFYHIDNRFTRYINHINRAEPSYIAGKSDAVFTMCLSYVTFIILFALTYTFLSNLNWGQFNAELSFIDGIYFSTTVATTTGFGDILAKGQIARLAVTVQMLIGVIYVVLLFSALSTHLRVILSKGPESE